MDTLIKISELKGESLYMYNSLKKFYDEYTLNNQQNFTKIINIINHKYKLIYNNKSYKLSLRFLDEFITRYCLYYKTTINVNNKYFVIPLFNIYIRYQAQLNSHHKDYFDPFKRVKECQKIEFITNNFKFITTLCQLNFFKWIIENDIIQYIENNFDTIIENKKKVDNFFENKKKLKKNKCATLSTLSAMTSENNTRKTFKLEL